MEGPHHYWKITAKQDCPMCKGKGAAEYYIAGESVFYPNRKRKPVVVLCDCAEISPIDRKEPA